jgi:hypothetical protein
MPAAERVGVLPGRVAVRGLAPRPLHPPVALRPSARPWATASSARSRSAVPRGVERGTDAPAPTNAIT